MREIASKPDEIARTSILLTDKQKKMVGCVKKKHGSLRLGIYHALRGEGENVDLDKMETAVRSADFTDSAKKESGKTNLPVSIRIFREDLAAISGLHERTGIPKGMLIKHFILLAGRDG